MLNQSQIILKLFQAGAQLQAVKQFANVIQRQETFGLSQNKNTLRHINLTIIGHSPGKAGSPDKSKTIQRVKRWLNQHAFYEYDWYNLVDYHAPKLKLGEVTLEPQKIQQYNKVIALGNLASQWLTKQSIEHLKVPHPSGLNRQWNNPETETITINNIKHYLD